MPKGDARGVSRFLWGAGKLRTGRKPKSMVIKPGRKGRGRRRRPS